VSPRPPSGRSPRTVSPFPPVPAERMHRSGEGSARTSTRTSHIHRRTFHRQHPVSPPKGVMFDLIGECPRNFKKITCRPPRSQADLSAIGRPLHLRFSAGASPLASDRAAPRLRPANVAGVRLPVLCQYLSIIGDPLLRKTRGLRGSTLTVSARGPPCFVRSAFGQPSCVTPATEGAETLAFPLAGTRLSASPRTSYPVSRRTPRSRRPLHCVARRPTTPPCRRGLPHFELRLHQRSASAPGQGSAGAPAGVPQEMKETSTTASVTFSGSRSRQRWRKFTFSRETTRGRAADGRRAGVPDVDA